MRSTPGRPYPLIIPLSTGLGKHSFAKIMFSHKVLTTFTQNVVFYLLPRSVVAHAAVWGLGGQGGTQNPRKNDMKKRCSKRGPKTALGGSMGRPREPREPKHAQNWSQKAAKMSPKTTFYRAGLDKWKLRRNIIIYYISSTSATPEIDIF